MWRREKSKIIKHCSSDGGEKNDDAEEEEEEEEEKERNYLQAKKPQLMGDETETKDSSLSTQHKARTKAKALISWTQEGFRLAFWRCEKITTCKIFYVLFSLADERWKCAVFMQSIRFSHNKTSKSD